MCKFDHENNLPEIFAKSNLSILPISRKAYIIGNFSLFAKIEYDDKLIPIEINIPHAIQTIKSTDLYSESAALHFAFHSGMIDDFVGEETKHTVSGRMGAGQFEYEVENAEGYREHVKVKGAQIEIDGGY